MHNDEDTESQVLTFTVEAVAHNAKRIEKLRRAITKVMETPERNERVKTHHLATEMPAATSLAGSQHPVVFSTQTEVGRALQIAPAIAG